MFVAMWPDVWHCAAVATILTACVLLARRWLQNSSGVCAGRASKLEELSNAAQDYPDLGIPLHSHLEIAMDPPTGLQCSNPRAPYAFENDVCKGTYLAFHPPTGLACEGAGSLDYGEYFKGKKRQWELRVSFQFKRPPPAEADMFFGIELENYVPLSHATKRVVAVMTAALRKAVGSVYQSPGDDPNIVKGECEKPTCVLPLWAFDQFIMTPEGKEPPSLTDVNFPSMGTTRANRLKDYVQEIDDIKRELRAGPTYTFAFWGPTRFVDAINWRLIGVPVVTPFDFDKLAGAPPVFASLYWLRPSENRQETRHLDSRKRHCFRAAIWSSIRRPDRDRFESLTGARSPAKMADEAETAAAPSSKRRGLRRHIGNMRKAIKEAAEGSVYCCTTVTRKSRGGA